MSKRFVPRGADPAADAIAAAEAPLPGDRVVQGKRTPAPVPRAPAPRPERMVSDELPRPVPAPTAVRDAVVRAAWAELVRDAERAADARRIAAGLEPMRYAETRARRAATGQPHSYAESRRDTLRVAAELYATPLDGPE